MPPRKKLFTSFKCDICHKGFETKWLLQAHEKIHTDEYKYSCPQCDFRCKVNKYLTRHINAIHRDRRNHECDICSKRFLFPSKLAAHKLVHTGEKPYKCNQCDKAFNTTYSLNTHKLIHTGEKPFKCSFCAYACRDCSTLRKHEANHSDTVRWYRCVTCGHKLKSKAYLKRHIAEKHLNLDIRKYFCDTCKKGFKTKTALAVHVQNVHMKAKRAKCALCGLTISNFHNMAQHMLTHLEVRPYSCTFEGCEKKFKTKSELKKHRVIHTPEAHVKCEICERTFSRLSRLERHILLHARKPKEKIFECVDCDDRFCNRFQLKKHRRVEHPGVRFKSRDKFECDLCGFITRLRSCIIMHLKYGHAENKYTQHCNECRKKFRTEYSYILHMATDHRVVVEKTKRSKKSAAQKAFVDEKAKKEDLKENVLIKEEFCDEEESPPIDLFEVDKEEVLEDHLPKEIKETIQNAIQNEMYSDEDQYVQKHDDNEDCTSIQEKFKYYPENNNHTDSIQNVRDTDLSLAFSIQCEDNLDTSQDKYKEENSKFNSNSIQNGDEHINEKNINQNITNYSVQPEDDTNSIQNNYHTIDLTDNEEVHTESIHIDKNNYLQVIKQLIIDNRSELKKISDEVFDEFFIDRVESRTKDEMKKKKKAEKRQKYLSVELREKAKKEVKKKLVKARRLEIARALERTRWIYNDRLNRALEVVNPKEKVKVKYFNKNKIQLVEMEPTQVAPEAENTDLNNTDEKCDGIDENAPSSSKEPLISSLNGTKNNKNLTQKNKENNNSSLDGEETSQTIDEEPRIVEKTTDNVDEESRFVEKTTDNVDGESHKVEKPTYNVDETSQNVEARSQSVADTTNEIDEMTKNAVESISGHNVDETVENLEDNPHSDEVPTQNVTDTIQNLDESTSHVQEISQNDKTNGNETRKNNTKCRLKINTHQCYVCFELYQTKEELLDHCKEHFDVATSTSLKKCPICAFVTKLSLGTHMRKAHGLRIKVPYGTIHDQNTNQRISKYYYKMNDTEHTEFNKIEVIPSIKCLNHIASRKIDKVNKEMKDKSVSKTKLVKKGTEWIVETEKVSFDKTYLLPKFDVKDIDIDEKKIKVNAKYKIVFSYIENLKRLYKIAKKKGNKMLFPCKDCEKVCLTLAALKLHIRKHDPNKMPFKKKVWKHKLKDNFLKEKGRSPKDSKKRKDKKAKRVVKSKIVRYSKEDLYNMSLKDRIKIRKDLKEELYSMSIRDRILRNKRLKRSIKKTINTNNSVDNEINNKFINEAKTRKIKNKPNKYKETKTKRVKDTENRERDPRPVKNKHKCDPQLIEFYNQNVKGGDIEFWQFLKIFNRMSRENVKDFSDLKERTDFGLHLDVIDDKNGDEGDTNANKTDKKDVSDENQAVCGNESVNNEISTIKSSNSKTVSTETEELRNTTFESDESNEEASVDDNNTINGKNNESVTNNLNKIEIQRSNNKYLLGSKTGTRMVNINKAIINHFNVKSKIGSVSKIKAPILSKNEIARREAKKMLLRKKLMKEIII